MVFAQVRKRPAIASRFKEVSKADRIRIRVERNSSNTNTATKNILRIFSEFLLEKDLPNEEAIPDAQLPDILRDFYIAVKQQHGAHYKLSSLKCIRAGLNRHLKETRSINIITDPRFILSTEMFRCPTEWTPRWLCRMCRMSKT